MRALLGLTLSALVLAFDATAAVDAGTCGEPFQQFDFWVGEWDVTNEDGTQLLGTNSVTPVVGGCGIREHWKAGDFDGVSLNMYDPVRDAWTQAWMDETPLSLVLEGGWDGTSMVLQGRNVLGTYDRIVWTPLDDGRVRQRWQQSSDGRTWSTSFDGYYARR